MSIQITKSILNRLIDGKCLTPIEDDPDIWTMAERNDSHLLDGGDSVGMTDNQYKGMLLDQLEDWQEILDLAIAAGNTEIQKKAEKQIAKINEKLKF